MKFKPGDRVRFVPDAEYYHRRFPTFDYGIISNEDDIAWDSWRVNLYDADGRQITSRFIESRYLRLSALNLADITS